MAVVELVRSSLVSSRVPNDDGTVTHTTSGAVRLEPGLEPADCSVQCVWLDGERVLLTTSGYIDADLWRSEEREARFTFEDRLPVALAERLEGVELRTVAGGRLALGQVRLATAGLLPADDAAWKEPTFERIGGVPVAISVGPDWRELKLVVVVSLAPDQRRWRRVRVGIQLANADGHTFHTDDATQDPEWGGAVCPISLSIPFGRWNRASELVISLGAEIREVSAPVRIAAGEFLGASTRR